MRKGSPSLLRSSTSSCGVSTGWGYDSASRRNALHECGTDGERHMPMVVNCVAYRHGQRLGDISVDEISDVLAEEGTFVWVGLHEPDTALLRQIQTEFGLHELAVEDALSAHQRPKLEEYGESLFVVLQTAQWWEDAMHLGETHLFV